MMFLILPMERINRLPAKLGKLGCIPSNRSPITPQTRTMIDCIMGGEQHVVGQTEDVLRHSRSCGDGGKASKGIVMEELLKIRPPNGLP